ncbi:MAG: hypothetical protein U0P45_08130 [Acidimicrobiales bacterium]
MSEEPWYLSVDLRAPDERELAVLRFLVGHDFPGADVLRAEVDLVQVRPSCGCGCASIALVPPGVDVRLPVEVPSVPAPLDITVLPLDGRPAGGMILWLSNGHLADLELYSVEDGPGLAMPDVRQLDVTVER